MRELRSRVLLSAHPVFTGSIAVLVVNDHVLKGRFGNALTGKLSDIAGVVMVACLLWIVVGRARVACAVTALAFVALKTMPGAAESIEPILGGITRRDPTDVLVVAVLVPLAVFLEGRRPSLLHLAQLLLLPLTLGTAVLATTATSCAPGRGVGDLVVADGALYVSTSTSIDDPGSGWLRSDDFGEHFVEMDAPATRPTGRTDDCLPDGTCFTVEAERFVEQTDADGATRAVYGYSEGSADRLELEPDGCSSGGRFGSVAHVDTPDGSYVFVSMGDQGIIRRSPDGTWEHVAVGNFAPTEEGTTTPFDSVAQQESDQRWTAIVLVASVVAGASLLLLRVRHPHRRALLAAAVFGIGLFAMVVALGISNFVGDGISPIALTAAAVVLFVASLSVALSQRRTES